MRQRATRTGAISSGAPAWLGLRLNGEPLRDLTAPIVLTANSTITGGRGGSYTLSGAISGAFGLTFAPDTGTTIALTAANTYTTTAIGAGATLQIGAGGTTGTLGTGNVVNDGTLIVNRSDAVTLSQAISGSGGLAQSGTGTTTISGAVKACTGPVTINAGSLVLNATGTVIGNNTGQASVGATASAGYVINSGGTLQIAVGSFWQVAQNQPVTISGGTLSGAGSGNYFNNITMNGGSIVSTGDAFRVGFFTAGGNWTLSGVNSIGTVNLVKGGATSHTFNVASEATTVSSIVDLATFQGLNVVKGGAGALIVNGTSTYTGTTTISAGVLQVGNGGATGALNSGAITNNASLTFNLSSAITHSAAISGTGSVTKSGAGSVTLSAANTYSGGTTVSAGNLMASNASAFGTGTVTLMDSQSGSNSVSLLASASGLTIANPITVTNQGTQIATIGPENVASSGFNVSFGGAITLNKTLRVNAATNGFTFLNGAISGAGDIIVNGSGASLADSRRVIFNNAASTFVGTVDVRNGGVADLRTTTTGSANNALAVGAGCQVSMTFGGARRFGALVGTGEITVRYAGGAATLEIGNGNASGTFSGPINDGVAPNAGAVSVVKVGTGLQIFNGASAYTAGATINGGTLQAGHVNAFGTSTITVNAGGTLNRAGFAIPNTIVNNGGSVIN